MSLEFSECDEPFLRKYSESGKIIGRHADNRRAGGGSFFLHSCSDNYCATSTSLKILGPSQQRSSHQVKSSDLTSKKLSNRVTTTVVERKI